MSTSPPERPTTERRRTEREPDASDDLVGAVVRLMPDAALVVDEIGRVVAANKLAEALFGYPAGGLENESVDQLVPERFRPGHAAHRSSYISHPTQRPMGAGLELWAKRRDGTEFPVDISLAPLGVPERPLTLAAVRDLTQRRAEWAALGRLAAIVAASDDAIVSMDLKGTVTSWNSGAQRLFGYGADEIVGRPIFRLVGAERRAEIEEQLARLRAGIRIPTRDTRRLRKDGSEIDVSESMSLIREPSGEPVGYTWLMRDIAERKLAEVEQRRLLIETQRRERWLEAISEIRLSLLGGGNVVDWLALIARRVCELADTEGAAILVAPETEPAISGGDLDLTLAAYEGEAMAHLGDQSPGLSRYQPAFAQVLRTAETWSSSGESSSQERAGTRREEVAHTGPLVVAALATSHGTRGVLVVTRDSGRSEFDRADIRMVETLAQQAALALEFAAAQTDRDQLALIADRERIARDLHDHVIQRLFAVGMSLQAATHSIADSRALDRINDSVEELDATIRDVRSTIFSLEIRAAERVESSTRSRILDVTSMAAETLGYQPRLQFDGPVDTRVPEEMVPDLLAVVRESLSNTARHAAASTVEVRIEVKDDLVVTVTDDGRGLEGATRSSGLANLRARAEGRSGSMSVGNAGRGGTRLVWRVPLPR